MDERNVYGIGPRIERGEARGAKCERCRWVMEKERFATPSVGANSSVRGRWKGSRLGGASFSRQNGFRCEHFDADGQNLAPAKISLEPQCWATDTDIKVAMKLLMLQSLSP